jgi:tetratricopeptide (TPR) repeat protein
MNTNVSVCSVASSRLEATGLSIAMIAAQTGRLEAAITLVGQAIGINPKIADYHDTLGNVLRNTGAIDEAIKEYRKAIQLRGRDRRKPS